MKLTNHYKLPQTLMNLHALQREEYSKGEAHMSVTQLMKSPRIEILQKKYYHKMEDDPKTLGCVGYSYPPHHGEGWR